MLTQCKESNKKQRYFYNKQNKYAEKTHLYKM